ncbi:Rhodanese-like domain-containing protein [Cryomyces antarcticus]|uniref:Cdc25 phosphatase Ibp1 n=1 Tax=Cryomyces antarcticus TaxID=329879 RepID=A0ABR0LRL6_9PEZI|nr:Cdc25 phosphatase Ibp1 [Cryomyces antarcticus]KAK5018367.1 Cdc25 phosphatase Ibp1 [Cryomyces antarcticus]KAK5141419.1 hypothetical protein LTR04_002617 [Oleoguttula sp. CCFEE 6159]KAK5201801.1 Cdc25 phosphatase Ibp1 [Cryomyces antarcticus]
MSNITIASLPRMSRESLASVVRSSSPSTAVVDVRDSDYIGGHIRGCMNVPSSELDYRIPELVRKLKDKDTVVFHCALSQQRGPSAALRYVRERNRLLGIDPNDEKGNNATMGGRDGTADSEQKVYVLEGGFTKWQEKYGEDRNLTEGYQKDLWQYAFDEKHRN